MRRGRGRGRGRAAAVMLEAAVETEKEEDEEEEEEGRGFFSCYLLGSLSPRFKGHTYIGFTVNPRRRIRQHNGEIRSGAWRTKWKRPWEMILCIYGFTSNVSALQFEWAWQHPTESLAVKKAAASFRSLGGVANKIKLAYTMLTLPAWQNLHLTVNFFSTKYMKHTASCPHLPEQMEVQVCPIEELPCYTNVWGLDNNGEEDESNNGSDGVSFDDRHHQDGVLGNDSTGHHRLPLAEDRDLRWPTDDQPSWKREESIEKTSESSSCLTREHMSNNHDPWFESYSFRCRIDSSSPADIEERVQETFQPIEEDNLQSPTSKLLPRNEGNLRGQSPRASTPRAEHGNFLPSVISLISPSISLSRIWTVDDDTPLINSLPSTTLHTICTRTKTRLDFVDIIDLTNSPQINV
ncbi:hypothetical protein ACLOJK_022899 [Asimina triloba]